MCGKRSVLAREAATRRTYGPPGRLVACRPAGGMAARGAPAPDGAAGWRQSRRRRRSLLRAVWGRGIEGGREAGSGRSSSDAGRAPRSADARADPPMKTSMLQGGYAALSAQWSTRALQR